MCAVLNRCAGIFLGIALILAGQTMAMARGAPGPVGHMVICTGAGPVDVLVDASGTPTTAPPFCPDCALCLFDAVAAFAGPVVRDLIGARMTAHLPVADAAAAPLPVPAARGPPSDV